MEFNSGGDSSAQADRGYGSLSTRGAAQRFLGQVGVYGIGTALQRIGAFVLLPIYIARLTPEEYGLLALVSLIPFVMPPVLTLGLPNAITRYYYEWVREGAATANLGMVWIVSTATLFATILVLDQLGEYIFAHLLTQAPFEPFLHLALWWAFFSGLSLCPLFLLRIREQSKTFVIVSAASFFLGTSLNIWAVLSGKGVFGILQMQVISSAVIGLTLTAWYLGQISFDLHSPSFKRTFWFGLPLVPSAFLEMTANRADRFFLDKWVPLSEVGIYSLANQIGQAVKFFYDSVKPAWLPFYIRVSQERRDCRVFLGHMVIFYATALCLVTLTVLLFAGDFVRWVSQEGRYEPALPLVPILAAAFFLQGLVPIGSSAMFVAEKTRLQPLIQLVQVVVVVLANVVLTRRWGAVGAAWALLISYGVLSGLYIALGQCVYPLVIRWKIIGGLFLGVLLLGAVACESFWTLTLTAKIAGFVFVVLSVGLLFFYNRSTFQNLAQSTGGRLRHP